MHASVFILGWVSRALGDDNYGCGKGHGAQSGGMAKVTVKRVTYVYGEG